MSYESDPCDFLLTGESSRDTFARTHPRTPPGILDGPQTRKANESLLASDVKWLALNQTQALSPTNINSPGYIYIYSGKYHDIGS